MAEYFANVRNPKTGKRELVPTGPPPPRFATVDEAKAAAKKQVVRYTSRALKTFVREYPMEEVISWPLKAAEARHVIDQGGISTLLETEAALTGETVLQLAGKITQKAAELETLIATLTGLRRNSEKRIEAAQTIEDVETLEDTIFSELSNAIDRLTTSDKL